MFAVLIIGISITFSFFRQLIANVKTNQFKSESAKETTSLSDTLLSLVDNKDPRAALEKLEEQMDDENVADICHGLAHEIGHKAYKKYRSVSKALYYKSGICVSGYIHGVIEESLAGSRNVLEDIKKICPVSNDGVCFHGVGHGLMYFSGNNLPQSISVCEELSTYNQKEDCVGGVFMENFNTDLKIHPSNYLKSEDFFYPCYEQKSAYKNVCYYYAPRYFTKMNPGKYLELVSWCQTVEAGYTKNCINGAGAAMIKENINNPRLVESVCDTLDSGLNNFCLEGMVNYYIAHHFSVSKGWDLCKALTDKNQQSCVEFVSKNTNEFPE